MLDSEFVNELYAARCDIERIGDKHGMSIVDIIRRFLVFHRGEILEHMARTHTVAEVSSENPDPPVDDEYEVDEPGDDINEESFDQYFDVLRQLPQNQRRGSVDDEDDAGLVCGLQLQRFVDGSQCCMS